jgi:hypothetical protein
MQSFWFYREGNTEEENNGYIVFKRNIYGSSGDRLVARGGGGRGLKRDVVYLGYPMAPSYMNQNAGEGGVG